jgi:hypothetical protein
MNKYFSILLVLISISLVMASRVFSAPPGSCGYHADAYIGLQLTQLTQQLETTGLIGRIHGAVPSAQLFVLSVREPNNFFNHQEFSLLPTNDATRNAFNKLNRHDRICVQGNFISNPSPQKHVAAKSIKVLEPWKGSDHVSGYTRNVSVPAELRKQTSLVGKVHAIAAEGQILVVEYKGGILPIFLKSTQYTKDLYRGDIIRLSYTIQSHPLRPTHLQLNLTAQQPIEVLDAIASWHGKTKTLSGKLIKFPRSPQLNFDVYAVEVETQGIKRDFTLVNLEDAKQFQAIRDRLSKIWESQARTAVPGRNMLINPNIMITASGRVNIVSPEQANPQILLNKVDDIQATYSGSSPARQ